MKNSTQIPFAFQDTPEPGENPGVGVRIKSLKKGANEKESAEGAAENQPEAKKQQDKPADPKLFDETIPDQATEGQIEAQAEKLPQAQAETHIPTQALGQIQAQTEAQLPAQEEDQSNSKTETQIHIQTEGLTRAQTEELIKAKTVTKSEAQISSRSDADIDSRSDAQKNSDSKALPQTSIENNNVNQELAHQAEYDSSLINDHEENEEDADLPIFRGSSLRTGLSVLGGNEIKDPGAGSNEIDSREDEIHEVDEPDNTNDGSEKPSKSTRGRKSLKTIDEGAELINIPPDEVLFQKQYYAIGEVAEMFHVNQSLLRFWETEFDIIQPRKNRKGDRHFRPVDIKNLLLIHDLLRRRKLTIEGAKDFLKKNKRSPERFAMIQSLQKIKGFILEIKATL